MAKLFDDPHWPRASTLLRSDKDSNEFDVGVVGIPCNASITPGNCHLSPAAIRESLALFSPYDLAHEQDLSELSIQDFGDLEVKDRTLDEVREELTKWLNSLAKPNAALVLLGGDNSITRPGVHALGEPLEGIGLLTFDAHFDLRDLGHGYHNGNPVRALLEDGLPGQNILQVGIQSFANSKDYAKIARQEGMKMILADQIHEQPFAQTIDEIDRFFGPDIHTIYVDFDIDVLDRGWCPGAPGARPGGILPWQAKKFAFEVGRNPRVRALDLVELDPSLDQNRVTQLAAASILLSFLSGVSCR
ncbi:MAG: agmatinase family protein [Armatimonadetes bacterium]|nr:agmatinase family protein [Armatimonadota bacterium]